MKIRLAKPISGENIRTAKFGLGSVPFEIIQRGDKYTRHARVYNDKGEGKWKNFRKLSVDVSAFGCEVSYVGSEFLKELDYIVYPRTVIVHAPRSQEVEYLETLCNHLAKEGVLVPSDFATIYETQNRN